MELDTNFGATVRYRDSRTGEIVEAEYIGNTPIMDQYDYFLRRFPRITREVKEKLKERFNLSEYRAQLIINAFQEGTLGFNPDY